MSFMHKVGQVKQEFRQQHRRELTKPSDRSPHNACSPDGAWKSTRGCQPRHSAAAPSSSAIRRSTGSFRQRWGRQRTHSDRHDSFIRAVSRLD